VIVISIIKQLYNRALVGLYDDVQEADELLEKSDIPFNDLGTDPFGISRNHIKYSYPIAKMIYRHYFKVKTYGIQNVPAEGRAMLVGNHSGGLPVDGTMVAISMVLDHDPPRYAIGMVDKFAGRMPVTSAILARMGQVTGLREQAEKLLNEERLLMIFPEGTRGVGKLYKDRYNLVEFTSGFMRLALRTNTPIIPFAFIGGEEAIKTVYRSKKLGKMFGAPYFPFTPYGLPLPMPVSCQIRYGEPMYFEGDENSPDFESKVLEVKNKVADLIDIGLKDREKEANS